MKFPNGQWIALAGTIVFAACAAIAWRTNNTNSVHELPKPAGFDPQIIASTSTEPVNTFSSTVYKLSLKYPEGWSVDEGLGGITITSFKSYVGFGIGTLPHGTFQADITLVKRTPENLNAWCRRMLMQFATGTYDLQIDTKSNAYAKYPDAVVYDFRSKQQSPDFNGRWLCFANEDSYVIVDAYPLDAPQLPVLGSILNTLTF
jgi:hypothetical protein